MRGYLYSRYFAEASGGKGGTTCRTGIERARASLRHDAAGVESLRVEVDGSMQQGVPTVRVLARDLEDGRLAVFYDGPLARIIEPTETRWILDFCRAALFDAPEDVPAAVRDEAMELYRRGVAPRAAADSMGLYRLPADVMQHARGMVAAYFSGNAEGLAAEAEALRGIVGS